MAFYSVALQGTPTSEITQDTRTYRVRFRICTDESVCDLYPAKINSTVISYDLDPCGGPPPVDRPIPAFYDLGFWGCEDEVDAGAILASTSLVDQKVDPSQDDLEDLAALRAGEVPGDVSAMLGDDGGCVVCRLYDVTYEADLVDGRSETGDIVDNACPEISIEPYVTQKNVDKATFRGFWRTVRCCTNDDPTEASSWGFLQANNTPESCDGVIAAAQSVLGQEISEAYEEYVDTLSTCAVLGGCDQAALDAADKEYRDSLNTAYAKFETSKNNCISSQEEESPCFPLVSGTCVTPKLPNGSFLNVLTEKTEEVVTIRHYAADLGPTDLFRSATNTVNCANFGIAIPCQNFNQIWPAGTLYLRFVRHSSQRLNGDRIWVREYQFHYSPDGWDEFIKNEGTERAICLGVPERKPFLEPGGEGCVDGEFSEENCIGCEEGQLGSASIVDLLGHPIQTPMPLDFNGQPLCDDTKENYTRWESICCSDFTLLPIPQLTLIDEERDGSTPPGGPTPPTVTCSDNNENNTWVVYYKGDQCTHTFTCTDVPPYGWVLTSSVGENCP